MKILLVEDDADFAARLSKSIEEIAGVVQVNIADNAEDAALLIGNTMHDCVVLDLGIPRSRQNMLPDIEVGKDLFFQVQELSPGTPVFILTGVGDQKFSRRLVSFGNQEKLWGSSENFESVSYFLKEEVDELLERISAVAKASIAAASVEINTRGRSLGLSEEHRRIIQSFAVKADAVMCDVSPLTGGLSDTSVYKVVARDGRGHPQAVCAAKLGPRIKIAGERAAYDKHVNKLSVGYCPAIFFFIDNAVLMQSGIFYVLTGENFVSLFDALNANPEIGPKVVEGLRKAFSRWDEAGQMEETLVRDVRRRILSDEDTKIIREKFSLDWLIEFENKKIFARKCCVHGDLHCGNVLVSPTADIALIDFDDVGQGHAAADPVNLELSLVFHPYAKKLGYSANLRPALNDWQEVSKFESISAFPSFISSTRQWLHDVAGTDKAALVAALLFAVRQLKYDTVPHAVTLEFIESIRNDIAG